VVGLLAVRYGERLRRSSREQALVAEARVGLKRIVLAFPQTFMNDSGRSVAALVRRHHLADLQCLVVVHDEMDLPVGVLRVKSGGGLAGHNGLKSIKAHLHSDAFTRIRIGIGQPPGRQQGVDYVLKAPGKSDRIELDLMVDKAADAAECVLNDGVVAAQNRFNG
jgi:PTH1 family peptidyl-tRNA hydrolase